MRIYFLLFMFVNLIISTNANNIDGINNTKYAKPNLTDFGDKKVSDSLSWEPAEHIPNSEDNKTNDTRKGLHF